jgi:4-amino-4-deoxy-L-arabinose transferase-like glycosyltransferase
VAWAERTALLVGLVTAIRWVIAGSTGLSDTEAYYAQWARSLALSYYDHPPLVAWAAWVGTRASSAPWAVRLVPVLCGAVFDTLVYHLAARLFSPRAGFFAVAILTAVPVFFFTGFLLNPEALLAPLWALFLVMLLDLRARGHAWRALAIGLVVGVAFLAKYTAILAVPVTLLYLAGSRKTWGWFRRPSLYAAGALALAIATPVIAWNAMHGWPSLQLHLAERMNRPAGEPLAGALWRVARGQLVFFQPIALLALVGAAAVAVVRSWRDERYWLLSTAGLPVLVFLLTMMVRAGDSEPHWTMIGYLPFIVAAAGLLDESKGVLRRFAFGVFYASVSLSALALAVYLVHLSTPALAKHLPSYEPNADPFAETIGWDRVAAAVKAHARRLGPETVVAGAHNVLCGHAQAALDDAPPVFCVAPKRTQYDFVGRRHPPSGAPVVFVDSERYPADPDVALHDHVCGPPQELEIDRSGLFQARYRLRDCLPRRGKP